MILKDIASARALRFGSTLSSAPPPAPSVMIRRTRGWRFLDMRELWSYRELIGFLTWRDVNVRYKRTALGILWALLQPLLTMVVFSLVFGRLAKMPSDGLPYALFALPGILPWQLFSRTISETTNSLVTDQRLITRVYFPRIIVPIASTLAGMVDFAVASALLIAIFIYYGVSLTGSLIWLPLFVVLMLVTVLGVGFWLSVLNVEYRDVKYTLPFLSQLWLFATPVAYPSSLVPDHLQLVYGLNPMAGVVEGFRWALLGVGPGPSPMLAVSALVSCALFVSGAVWFRARERTLADSIGSGGR